MPFLLCAPLPLIVPHRAAGHHDQHETSGSRSQTPRVAYRQDIHSFQKSVAGGYVTSENEDRNGQKPWRASSVF